MRKCILMIALLLCACFVSAQAIDVSKLDFSQARVSMAGPDKVYVRSVMYDGQSVSVTLTYDGESGATIEGPFIEDKLFQDTDEVAYATITKSGENSITVSPIVVGGQAYAYVFEWTPDTNKLAMVQSQPTDMPNTYESLLAMVDKDRFQIAALNDQLSDAKAAAQANATSLGKQLADEQAKTADLTGKLQAAQGAAVQPGTAMPWKKRVGTQLRQASLAGRALMAAGKARRPA